MSDITDDSTTIDSARYRQVLGHFPTGVTIITAGADDGPVGVAIGSFTSLSLDPAQVLFCIGTGSSTWPKIRDTGSFCANILGSDQESVSRVFASKAADKFAGLGFTSSRNGNPILDGVLAYVDCTIADVVESGDHHIVIGAVSELAVCEEGHPLVFFRGGYGRFEV